jgi:hypothetical protein
MYIVIHPKAIKRSYLLYGFCELYRRQTLVMYVGSKKKKKLGTHLKTWVPLCLVFNAGFGEIMALEFEWICGVEIQFGF